MLVISLCDYSGIAVLPWLANGYECWIVDMLHPKGSKKGKDGIRRIGADIRDWKPKGINPDIILCWPPCDHLAVSGAKHFKGKGLHKLADAIKLVACCADICNQFEAPWMIENPVSTLATYWRKPDGYFHPYQYAGYLEKPYKEAYCKKTCLWIGNGFVIPEKKRYIGRIDKQRIHYASPTEDRASFRSQTPLGFATAVFQANHKAIVSR